jgi:hypothetical protein
MSEADLLLRLGRVAAAVTLYTEALAKLDERTMVSESLWGYGGLALARLRAGDVTGAHVAAERARGFIADGSLSAFWTLQGIASTAETLLLLWERGWRSPDVTPAMLGDQAIAVCRGLRRYARNFRVGRPNALLWRGYHAWLSGRRGPGCARASRRCRPYVTYINDGGQHGGPHLCVHAHAERWRKQGGSQERELARTRFTDRSTFQQVIRFDAKPK